jgi:Na+/melibiose symporter-like transporter
MSTIGIIFGVVMPLLASWLGRDDLIKFCKQDNKIVFKRLIYILLGVIAWTAVSVFFYEQRKTDPYFGWGFVIVTCVVSGCIILNRCLEKGWKKSLLFQPSAFEQVVRDYDKLQAEENARWKAFSDSYTGDKDDYEYRQLMEDHFDKYDAIDRECEVELDKVRGVKKKEDWVLLVFYIMLGIMGMKVFGHAYDYAFDYVMTFGFVKGREWLANTVLIGCILAAIGAVFSYYDEKYRKNNP